MKVNTVFVANWTTQEVGKESKKMTGLIESWPLRLPDATLYIIELNQTNWRTGHVSTWQRKTFVDWSDKLYVYNQNYQSLLLILTTVEPPCAITSPKRSLLQKAKIFPIQTLQLEPLVNDLLATATTFRRWRFNNLTRCKRPRDAWSDLYVLPSYCVS